MYCPLLRNMLLYFSCVRSQKPSQTCVFYQGCSTDKNLLEKFSKIRLGTSTEAVADLKVAKRRFSGPWALNGLMNY
jgi:hypothetical protein